MKPLISLPHCLSPGFVSANQVSASPACRPIRSRKRSASSRPRLPRGRTARAPAPRRIPPSARPGSAPPRQPRLLVAPSLTAGRWGRVLSERQKKERGRLGDRCVTGRGFITFTFAIDNIAKCMKETAPPGQERKGAGKVSIPRAGFARRRGHRERMGSGHHPHTECVSGSAL